MAYFQNFFLKIYAFQERHFLLFFETVTSLENYSPKSEILESIDEQVCGNCPAFVATSNFIYTLSYPRKIRFVFCFMRFDTIFFRLS